MSYCFRHPVPQLQHSTFVTHAKAKHSKLAITHQYMHQGSIMHCSNGSRISPLQKMRILPLLQQAEQLVHAQCCHSVCSIHCILFDIYMAEVFDVCSTLRQAPKLAW